jgi:transposase
MVVSHAARRQRSTRDPFRTSPWDDNHPEFCRIEALLPADHHARWLRSVVSHLDLAALRRSYANRGSLAYLPELLLPFVLFMYSRAILSPAEWAKHATYDDQAKWLLRGLSPSRSQLYTFRDRVEPYLDDWHAQIIAWAIFEKITTAERGSLDGTLVAALASRHRLLSRRRVDQRLLLLRLLVWGDDNQIHCDLTTFLEDFAAWHLVNGAGQPLSSGKNLPPSAAALETLTALLGPVLDGQVLLPVCLPAWVPATPAGRKRVLQRYMKAQERLAQRLEPYQQKKKLSKKDKEVVQRMKVSLTDSEAALGWDKMGTYRPLYNLLLVQATDAPLTLAWEVLGRNNDQGLIRTMMEKVNKQVGHYLKELLVDGGFLNVSDAVWCEKEGVVLYAPPAKVEAAKAEATKAEVAKAMAAKAMAAKAAVAKAEMAKAEMAKAEMAKAEGVKAEGTKAEAAKVEGAKVEAAKVEGAKVEAAKVAEAKAEAAKVAEAKAEAAKVEKAKAKGKKEKRGATKKGGAKKAEQKPKSAFRYDSAADAYICPKGKRLEPVSRTKVNRQGGLELPMIVYQASGKDCQACPEQAGCTSNPKKGRTVKRYEGEEALDRLEARMREPAAQQIYKLRCQTVELGNADLKEHRGLRVFRCFGRKRARAQAGLIILASNGLKIMHALQRRDRAAQPPSPLDKRAG